MRYDSSQIANFFIEQSLSRDKEITPMQAIKLTYIAHGWYLGIMDGPLVKERVQAWRYGPVFLNLYHKLKRYGNQPIPELIQEKNKDCRVPPSDESVLAFLQRIWDLYKNYSGTQLSSMCHAPDTPWHSTIMKYKNKGHFPMHLTINNEDIKCYYKAKYKEMAS